MLVIYQHRHRLPAGHPLSIGMLVVITLLSVVAHCVYGLVGRTTMRNLSENHTGRAVQTVISSLARDSDGFPSLVRILTNAHFLVGSLYTDTCATWSINDFESAVKYSNTLHPLQRDRVLQRDCLNKLPFQKEAYQILRDSKIPTNLPEFMKSLLDPTEWLKVFSIRSPEYISNWCLLIPKVLLTAEFLSKVNLPYYMSPKCLNQSYANKNLLVNALTEQIGTRNHWSLLKLLNTLRFINSKLATGVRTKLKQRICDNGSKKMFHLMNATFLRCSWVRSTRPEEVLDLMRKKVLDGETLVMAMRMWIKRLKVVNTVSMLGKKHHQWQVPYSHDSIVLLQELSDETIFRQKTFFDFLDLNIEYVAYHAPFSIWKNRSEGQLSIYSMPLRWRLLYYRGWQMLPRERRAPRQCHEFKPFHYWSKHSFDEAKRRIDKYLAERKYFNMQSGLVFPVPSVPERVLEFVIGVMIASIIQKGVDMLRFDPTYCVSLRTQDMLRFSQSSLPSSNGSMSDSSSAEEDGLRFSQSSRGDLTTSMSNLSLSRGDALRSSQSSREDLYASMSNLSLAEDLQELELCMEAHRKVFSKVYKDWKLSAMVEESKFCEFLSTDIAREVLKSAIVHNDPRTQLYEEYGCSTQ
ncbi:hypothetical protein PSACC_01079 [Paramicrosporidium saccamoebae]|uniref:Uncharacterized protein n=1 Tax=Paramicrosporidium saccamoebae TaxID=1246581 RepID=A0A2H9TMU9_9FUNG|nr:hypothetical protein PSACC_01079 [Paramicrosporidium saccamoebae]